MAQKLNNLETVETKLRNLYNLQLVDYRILQISLLQGELPNQVRDLEDTNEGFKKRLLTLEEKLKTTDTEIKNKKNIISEAKKLIKQYEAKESSIGSQKELNSLQSEIEYQGLEIQLAEKQIKTLVTEAENLQQKREQLIGQIQKQNELLKEKKKELSEILIETEAEEKQLKQLVLKLEELVEPRLLTAYQRIKKSSKNGLVVVPIQRNASIGSYILIPPQRQIEVAGRNKIIVDEHSGRILIDTELAQEQEQYIEEIIKNLDTII